MLNYFAKPLFEYIDERVKLSIKFERVITPTEYVLHFEWIKRLDNPRLLYRYVFLFTKADVETFYLKLCPILSKNSISPFKIPNSELKFISTMNKKICIQHYVDNTLHELCIDFDSSKELVSYLYTLLK